jgi:hypothetical protein
MELGLRKTRNLALPEVSPWSGVVSLPATREDRVRQIPESEYRQQNLLRRAGVARHVESHLKPHVAPSYGPLHVGFDCTVKGCGSEIVWIRAPMGSNGQ